ncbi:hypothetical protein CRUP_017764 [Coryphaenoides rupestris]|nr:hypothetical protein CRUP_017764 [Coryphaenoides rupestris]
MAAPAPLARDTLPDHWSYGVCRDGRVFFINDKTQTTTWLHPRTAEPVNSGHMIRSDLPRGWEEGFTDEGASYFINHNQRGSSFRHPVTGQISPENTEYTLQDRLESRMSKQLANQRTPSVVSQSSAGVTSAVVDSTAGSRNLRGSGKVHSFGKRDHAIKRNLNIPVVVRGWLYKQDSSGMRLWKRKWFVFADTQEDLNGWMQAMNQAARMQPSQVVKREVERPEKTAAAAAAQQQQAVPQRHHSSGGTHKPSQAAEREEPQDNGVRLAPGEERPVHGRPAQPATGQEGRRSDGRSPVPGSGPGHKNGHRPTVIQVSAAAGRQKERGVQAWPRPQLRHGEGGAEEDGFWLSAMPPSAEYLLPRRTPPTKPKANGGASAAHLPPAASSPPAASKMTSDYKYAHDRLSHFCMSTDERLATKEGMVWQLYEWQQRQQFRHGSPTAPIYSGGPGFVDASAFRVTVEMPRSVSVPPSPSDLQPPRVPASFKSLSPRRPHTPLDRVTVKPLEEPVAPPPGDSTTSHSPRTKCVISPEASELIRAQTDGHSGRDTLGRAATGLGHSGKGFHWPGTLWERLPLAWDTGGGVCVSV